MKRNPFLVFRVNLPNVCRKDFLQNTCKQLVLYFMENHYDSFLGFQIFLVASIRVYQKIFSCPLAGVRIVSGKLLKCCFKHLFRLQAVWDLSKKELTHIELLVYFQDSREFRNYHRENNKY